jgi:hypothetical protein
MPHAERKKKGGERKDKKNARMREDVQARRESEAADRSGTDQPDIQNHKPGSANDANRAQPPKPAH